MASAKKADTVTPTGSAAAQGAPVTAASSATAASKATGKATDSKKSKVKGGKAASPKATAASSKKSSKADTGKATVKAGAAKASAKDTKASGKGKVTTKEKAARLVVKEDEAPWTKAELKEIRAGLLEEMGEFTSEIERVEAGIKDLIRDSADGSGDDEADAGAKTFEREHEITLANNARTMMHQAQRALEQIDAGTYGICESCGEPIGKLRLQAQPRATLCLTCKAKQERR